jgi:hypothetical protein
MEMEIVSREIMRMLTGGRERGPRRRHRHRRRHCCRLAIARKHHLTPPVARCRHLVVELVRVVGGPWVDTVLLASQQTLLTEW